MGSGVTLPSTLLLDLGSVQVPAIERVSCGNSYHVQGFRQQCRAPYMAVNCADPAHIHHFQGSRNAHSFCQGLAVGAWMSLPPRSSC